MKATIILLLSFLISFETYANDGNDVVKHTLELPEFHSIALNSSYSVHVKQTNKQEVSVEAIKEIYDASSFEVKDGVLHINIKKNDDARSKTLWSKIDNIKIAPTLKVYVSMKQVRNLEVNGNGKIISENSIAAPEINLLVSGPGEMDVDLKGTQVNSIVSGAGKLKIKGYASNMEASLSGSGNIHAAELEVEKTKAHVSGSGICELNVREELNATVHGPGKVEHKGNTRTVNSQVFGQGTVIRVH